MAATDAKWRNGLFDNWATGCGSWADTMDDDSPRDIQVDTYVKEFNKAESEPSRNEARSAFILQHTAWGGGQGGNYQRESEFKAKFEENIRVEKIETDDEQTGARIYDSNAINAETKDMTEKEVNHFCSLIRKHIAEKFGYDSEFRVNTITYKEEGSNERVLKGVSYIYWKLPQVYHIILGNNPDGSNRVTQVYISPDGTRLEKLPDEIAVPDPVPPKDRTWNEMTNNPVNSWGKIMDDKVNTPKREEAPLKLPEGYKIETRREKSLIPDLIYVRLDGTRINVNMSPLFITIWDDAYNDNIDYHKLSGVVPARTTESILHSMFDIFSHTPGFPKIEIKQVKTFGGRGRGRGRVGDAVKNIAFITFSRQSHDARFARELCLFSKFKVNDKVEIVRFDHPCSRN